MPPWWKQRYKAPAAFSATNEFLGYIVGDANTPYELVVFYDGYRYVLNLMTGYLCPKLSIPYTYGSFIDLYDFQYRGNDLVCGFNDPTLDQSSKPVSWSYCRTTPVGSVSGILISHAKVWSGSSWGHTLLSTEVRATISAFQFHKWVQVNSIPFSIPFSLPVIISVDY
jgi:hypothetical protein